MCDHVCDLLLEECNVQPVSSPVTVCGDIHGQVRRHYMEVFYYVIILVYYIVLRLGGTVQNWRASTRYIIHLYGMYVAISKVKGCGAHIHCRQISVTAS